MSIVILGARSAWHGMAHALGGAEHLAEPRRRLRRAYGLSTEAGGPSVVLAAAGPEIGINAASALRDVPEVRLGVMLGSARPLVISLGWLTIQRGTSSPRKESAPTTRLCIDPEGRAFKQSRIS